MTPRKITKERAVFIGGPLDWQLIETNVEEKLQIVHEGKVETYHRKLVTDHLEEFLLVLYLHDSEMDIVRKPFRLRLLVKMWMTCVEDYELNTAPTAIAKGLVDADHEFHLALKNITKNDKKRVRVRDGSSR